MGRHRMNNREMSFYIDEGCGYSIDIEKTK